MQNGLQIKVKKLHHNAKLPTLGSAGAACFDLHACLETSNPEDFVALFADDAATIRTGLAFEIPKGHVMLIYSRSGHGFKNNVRLANSVGVIDSDYRGEVQVKLTNDGQDDDFVVRNGDRIAQAMIIAYADINFVESAELSETVRGEGGFGSTGR